jgi:hypothetical protein
MGWPGNGSESDGPITGHVRDVEPAAYTKISALGVEEQRVNVIIEPDRLPPMVGDGFRVEVSIVVWSAREVVVVPTKRVDSEHECVECAIGLPSLSKRAASNAAR